MSELRFDPALFSEFIDESLDSLNSVEPLLLRLTESSNVDIINQIFRPFHSLKGNSAFFGLFNLKSLSHSLENILDSLRKGSLICNASITETLLRGLDAIKTILINARNSQKDTADPKTLVQIQDAINQILSGNKSTFNQIVPEIMALIDNLDNLSETNRKSADSLRIKLRSFLGRAPDSKNESIQTAIPDQLVKLQNFVSNEFVIDETSSKFVLSLLDELAAAAIDDETRKIIQKFSSEYSAIVRTIGYDSLLKDLILQGVGNLTKKGKWPIKSSEEASTECKNLQSSISTDKTMRVSERTIDTFLAYVGELVIVEEMLAFLHKKITSLNSDNIISVEFGRTLQTFKELSSNLQKSIMAVRQVPLSQLFQKVPRIINDVSLSTGKKVQLEIQGETILIDKSHIETLDAPLVHLIRNAVDHGIEKEEDRVRSGKKPAGKVRIHASIHGSELMIEISDDGKGINYDKLRKKAESAGLLRPDAFFTQEMLTELIFLSGMSTAEKITDISGRGVGLEIVKNALSNAGGKITVHSEKNNGTCFTLTLPTSVSTQIIQGFLVRSRDLTIVFPLENIKESFSSSASQISNITGTSEVVLRHGHVLPVKHLSKVLDPLSSPPPYKPEANLFIVVQKDEKNVAIHIDELEGVQTVVVKKIDGVKNDNFIFDGGAIKGDGKVALIIGTSGLRYLFT